MKNAILKLLQEHKALSGRQIGEAIDPIGWPSHIIDDLQELVNEGKIIQNPLEAKMWDTYTWSLKPQYLSMGCIVTDHRCRVVDKSKPATSHVEIGWHRDPITNEPVFDEMSICAGPDPNGLTDLF
jgi:hypothetical protein